MKPIISVGGNIYRLRKEARLTQDDLASYLGVTKASVSKWETGQSYPDIELLPRIATYFDTSVDKILGYEPQMGRDGIRRECDRLRAAFANEPFKEAHARCQELVRDYYACYPLLAQIAVLYLNHLNLVEGDEREKLADEAIGLCRRIKRNSESSADIRFAEAVEANFHLAMGKPQGAVEALADAIEYDMGMDILLANAYSALGQVDEADKTLQGALFQSLALCLNRLSSMAMLYVANPAKLDVAHSRACAILDAFEFESVFVNAAAIHISFAMAYVMSGNVARALDCLEDYERAARLLEFPLKLHGDAFFDKAEEWIEDASVTGTSAPRDEALIKQSLVESVAANPAFAPLAAEPRFMRIVKSLEEIVR